MKPWTIYAHHSAVENTVKNVESDVESHIYTDQYPIKARIRINLKAKHETQTGHHEYRECEEEQKDKYNEEVRTTSENEQIEQTQTAKVLKAILKRHANEHIPTTLKYAIKQDISKEAARIVKERGNSRYNYDEENTNNQQNS